MQVKLGMPEVLVIFSLLMFSQSFSFSIIAFCLGVFSRVGSYLVEYGQELKKAEAINQTAEEFSSALTGLFSANKD